MHLYLFPFCGRFESIVSFNKGTGSYLIDFEKFDLTASVRTPKTSQYALDNGLSKRKRSGFDAQRPAGDGAADDSGDSDRGILITNVFLSSSALYKRTAFTI
jgi:hypothetical protein